MEQSIETDAGWARFFPVYQWLVYIPMAVATTVVGALIAVPLGLLVSSRWANVYVAVWWAKVLTRLAGVRVEIIGQDHVDPTQSYVLVANHQSAFDIPVIYGYSGLDLRWVMKAEIKWIPFVAAGCRAIGHVFVERGNTEQATAAINRAVHKLQAGTGVLFFPEGTRSLDGQLLPFKKGAFRLALDQGWPVLPVTVVGTRDVLPPKRLSIRPRVVQLQFHPPIPTTNRQEQVANGPEVGKLMEEARVAILSGLP